MEKDFEGSATAVPAPCPPVSISSAAAPPL